MAQSTHTGLAASVTESLHAPAGHTHASMSPEPEGDVMPVGHKTHNFCGAESGCVFR